MPVRSKEDAASPAKKLRTTAGQDSSRQGSTIPTNSHRAGSESDIELSRQQGTLYDAVAGRLGYEGFIMDGRAKPVPAEDVLFRRQGAPVRYEENDPYWASRDLPPGVKLPNSDLLKIVHAYVSDFYGSGAVGHANESFRSMDETALLALVILLEETAGQKLGETGDLAFVEGEKK